MPSHQKAKGTAASRMRPVEERQEQTPAFMTPPAANAPAELGQMLGGLQLLTNGIFLLAKKMTVQVTLGAAVLGAVLKCTPSAHAPAP